MSAEVLLKNMEDQFAKSFDHLKDEFASLQIGRASSALVERVMVEVYGLMQPLKAVASISVPDAKTVQIQPWDRGTLQAIEKAIKIADLGLNPQNDGIVVRLNIPPLTEERRKDLTKVVSKMAEECKITIRSARQDCLSKLKAMEKNSEITEDQLKHFEKKIQENIEKMNEKIEHASKEKEADIMKV